MSAMSEQDHLNPRDPLYYAPRELRERSRSRLTPPAGAGTDQPFAPASFESELENAVSQALRHPLDPEVIQELPEFTREMDRRGALFSVAGRFAAAVGVSALVALFFVVMVPASRQSDGDSSASPGIVQSIRTAVLPQPREAASKSAISEFQPILTSTQAGRPANPEQAEQLLKQFMQWREKPAPTAP